VLCVVGRSLMQHRGSVYASKWLSRCTVYSRHSKGGVGAPDVKHIGPTWMQENGVVVVPCPCPRHSEMEAVRCTRNGCRLSNEAETVIQDACIREESPSHREAETGPE